jgi:UDP:flavonoid glycosyltransferase YjiC (YdhE family)
MAVPPNLVEFVESTGITAVAYGPDSQAAWEWEFLSNLWSEFPRNLSKPQRLASLWQETRRRFIRCWQEMSATLTSQADGADILVTGLVFEQQAFPIAEYYDIPLVALHHIPIRPNGCLIPVLPPSLTRSGMKAFERLHWFDTKKLEDAQRRDLGLPKATGPAPRLMAARGALEIQAYDEVCFPGLAAEWNGKRPFVGALTLELATDDDDDVASWIAAGASPIYFGFGSTPVKSPSELLTMISAACEELGERALVCSGWTDFDSLPHSDHVKVARSVNFAAVFPTCRAVVHHGGSGTTAAGLRAGIPTSIHWGNADMQIWGSVVNRLKVGTSRRLSSATRESLVADLRTILEPDYVARARELETMMTKPAASVATAADLVESRARERRTV